MTFFECCYWNFFYFKRFYLMSFSIFYYKYYINISTLLTNWKIYKHYFEHKKFNLNLNALKTFISVHYSDLTTTSFTNNPKQDNIPAIDHSPDYMAEFYTGYCNQNCPKDCSNGTKASTVVFRVNSSNNKESSLLKWVL